MACLLPGNLTALSVVPADSCTMPPYLLLLAPAHFCAGHFDWAAEINSPHRLSSLGIKMPNHCIWSFLWEFVFVFVFSSLIVANQRVSFTPLFPFIQQTHICKAQC